MNLARLFGTPASVLPRNYGEFCAYFEAELAGGAITVTPAAREVASVILTMPLPAPLRILAPRAPACDGAHPAATAARE
jgi:uncharacterized protein (DUF2236 family)